MRLTRMLSASILAVAAIPASAFAADWYLGTSVGPSTYSSQLLGFDTATAIGYDLFAGYRLNPHWALELSYFDMAPAKASKGAIGPGFCVGTQCAATSAFQAEQSDADTNGFALMTVGNLPFGDTWSAFLTVGAANTNTEVTPKYLTLQGRPQSKSASKWVLSYGAGVQANTGGSWAFRLGWRTLNNVGNSATTGSGDVGFVYLSALCTF